MKSRILFTLLAVAIVAAQCSQPVTVVVTKEVEKVVTKEVPAGESLLAGAKLKVAGVFPGPVNDAGWTTAAYLGLVNLRDKYGYEIAYSEQVAVADAEQVMREYAKAGYDVVLAHGFEYADPIHKVAEEYPKTNFIQTNGSADDLKNLYTITFSAGEGGYFMGRLACEITRNGKVAYFAGTEFPVLAHHVKMSRQACKDIGRGDVAVIESYVGSWNDPAKAKELAAAAIEQGVDVLILEADAGDPGTIEAAVEAAKEGKYVRVISWVKDKNYLAPDLVIGGWEERVPRNIEYCVEKIIKGEPGGHFAIGLKEGAVGLNPFYGLVPPEVENDIVVTLQKYMQDPASLPNLEVRTDL
jgi:basic membrane protein A